MALQVVTALSSATLLQGVVFAILLTTERFRASTANRFLAVALALIAASKLDELYQLNGGLVTAPHLGFVLTPLQALITPALYFFVKARLDGGLEFRATHLAHLAPAVLLFAYLFATYYRHPADAKAELVAAGALSNFFNATIAPAAFDLVQIGYVAAAVAMLQKRGLELKQDFSRVENRDLSWMRPLLALWGGALLLHLAYAAARGFGPASLKVGLFIALDAAQFLFVPVLVMLAVVDYVANPAAAPRPKYAASAQSDADRRSLLRRAEAALESERAFLDPDLSLQDFASRLAVTPRELSEAINGAGDETFFAFVNRRRVDHAKHALLARPAARILDIALECGFNSKSTFNETFRRFAGVTPSGWRRRGEGANGPARPVEGSC